MTSVTNWPSTRTSRRPFASPVLPGCSRSPRRRSRSRWRQAHRRRHLAPYNPAAAARINDRSPRFRVACSGQIPLVEPRADGMRGRMPSGPVLDRYPEQGGRAGRLIADRRVHRC